MGPATLTAVSRQLIPFLLRAASVNAHEQVWLMCGCGCRAMASNELGLITALDM